MLPEKLPTIEGRVYKRKKVEEVRGMDLEDQIGYELFLFEEVLRIPEICEAQGFRIKDHVYNVRSDTLHEEHLEAKLNVCEDIGTQAESFSQLTEKLFPLFFIASFKILDSIVEFVLVENGKPLPIAPPFWNYKKKEKEIQNVFPTTPDLFCDERTIYLFDSLKILFGKLIGPRNTVVHRHDFKFQNNSLIVYGREESTLPFKISSKEMASLVIFTHKLAKILITPKKNPFDDCFFKYHLDILRNIHGQDSFDVPHPLFTNVILESIEHDGKFPVEVSRIRELIENSRKGAPVFFDLRIIGLNAEGGRVFEKEFAYSELPARDFNLNRRGEME